ncbi:prepilin peptidase [candidate division WOR-3 bacterium]|nr:prepilin peptidase [candidate division WOR-3 bacterium]
MVIYRLPRKLPAGLSLSKCEECGKRIQWYDNIPVLSYIILKGRCRYCRASITIRYPLIEVTTGLIFMLTFYQFGISIRTLSFLILFLFLLAISFIDLDTNRIPDVLTLSCMIIGFGLSFWTITWFRSIIGIVTGIGLLYIFAIVGKWVLKQDAMGGGDIKLLGMIGSFLGPIGVLLTLFFGAVIGLVVSVPMKRRKVPFGPFLSAGAFIYVFWGEKLIKFIWNFNF